LSKTRNCFIATALVYAIRKVQEDQVGLKLNGTHQVLVYADDVDLLGGNIDTVTLDLITRFIRTSTLRSYNCSLKNLAPLKLKTLSSLSGILFPGFCTALLADESSLLGTCTVLPFLADEP
jgi:hypothetical protein